MASEHKCRHRVLSQSDQNGRQFGDQNGAGRQGGLQPCKSRLAWGAVEGQISRARREAQVRQWAGERDHLTTKRERCSAKGCRVARSSGWGRSPHRLSPSRQTSLARRLHASPSAATVRLHQPTEEVRGPLGASAVELPSGVRIAFAKVARLPPGSVRGRRELRDRQAWPRRERVPPRTASRLLRGADRPWRPRR